MRRLCASFITFGLGFLVTCTLTVAVSATAAESGEQKNVTGQAAPENPVLNASFEEGTGGKPASWKAHTWGGKARFDRPEAGHSGSRSLMVSSDEGADAGWSGGACAKPYSNYRFTGWVKTENVVVSNGKGALFNVITSKPSFTRAIQGTENWTKIELTFDTGDCDYVKIDCILGGAGLATGTAWFDDLQLELLSSNTPKPAITVDAGQTAAPISKYIYGQFIEHLGRCIYGGIWAEMLEDRKFFYKVTTPESPWRAYLGIQKPTGDIPAIDGTIVMDERNAFVGQHSPHIQMGGKVTPFGILQSGLALRNGKEYIGRVALSGDPEAAPIEVSLIWGARSEQRQSFMVRDLTKEYRTFPFKFLVTGDTDDGRIQIAGHGKGHFWIGTVSLMPADNVHGMRADTLELLKELDSPVYRWPGGNFVSGYDWRDGIGDPDRRPPRKNPAWKGIEHNDFGIDEFMTFCRLINTEPYVAVNSGLGKVEGAVEELQYANGAADTPMGKLRAQNGHPEPYGVRWWSVGNEMYGDWQLGHMPLADYVKKHNTFAEAMRAVDPSIKVIAVGATGDWSKTMLAECANHMDLLSEHFYCGEIPGVLSHMRQMTENVRGKADAHRRYHKEIAALAGKHIPIALDEWNYWYGETPFGELGTRYFLKDALGIAAGLHEYARNSDIFEMANYAQTVNVIGAIKTTQTAAAFETTGLVLKLYRQHFGTIPVVVAGDTAPLDLVAAWRADKKALTVAIVNPTADSLTFPFSVKNVGLSGSGKCWQIAGSDPKLYNEPGKEPQVRIEESSVQGLADTLTVPAFGVSLYELETR